MSANPITPTTLDELRDAVAQAFADGAAFDLRGRGTKSAFGRPVQASQMLELSRFSGIRSYEPAELVLTAGAATPLVEVEQALAARGQMLAFEPPDFSALLGGADAGSLGGALAANLAGPRRIKAGAARDHFLGATAVNGRGEIFRSGGKVVKNVTGYDLCKLLAGSFGTLAAMEEVTVKVLPAPEKAYTALLLGVDGATAAGAMADALNSQHEVTAAAYLPRTTAARSSVGYVRNASAPVLALRVEGSGDSVQARCKALCGQLSHLGPIDELHTMNTGKLWREIRDVAALLPADKAVWRISVPPSAGAAITAALTGEWFTDWGGGLIWLAVDPADDCAAAAVRAAIRASGGHATLVRAPLSARTALAVFQPQDAALAALSARIKDSFDPKRILNPGRMYAEI